jgi:hypothetical protein
MASYVGICRCGFQLTGRGNAARKSFSTTPTASCFFKLSLTPYLATLDLSGVCPRRDSESAVG